MRHEVLIFDGFRLDLERQILFDGNGNNVLSGRPAQVLIVIASRPGELVPRGEILLAVWGSIDTPQGYLDQSIASLRRALGDSPRESKFVKTVYGEGVRFTGRINQETPSSNPATSAPEESASELFPSPVPTFAGDAPRRSRNAKRIFSWSLIPWAFGIAGVVIVGLVLRPTRAFRITQMSVLTESSRGKLSPVLTDGAYLYWEEQEGTTFSVGTCRNSGGDATTVPIGMENPDLSDIYPDGSALLIRGIGRSRDNEAPLFTVAVGGGVPQAVGKVIAVDGTVFPDGRHILFTRAHGVYKTDLTGSRIDSVASLPGVGFWPKVSPDGKIIRLTVINPASYSNSIWEVDVYTGNARRIFDAGAAFGPPCCGSWTRDGKYFVFQAPVNGVHQFWMTDNAGSAPVQLTFGPVGFRGPAISRDGRTIFGRVTISSAELVRYDPKNRIFAPVMTGTPAGPASYSPDGGYVAYINMHDNSLWRSRTDGSDARRLTPSGIQAALPRWAPNRSEVAFMARSAGRPWDIYTVRTGGGAMESIVPSGMSADAAHADPDWSPDGSSIVFGGVSSLEKDPAGVKIQIWSRLTRQLESVPGSKGYFSPRWSPKGNFIAAIQWDGSGFSVFDIANRTWSRPIRIACGYPSWSVDERYITLSRVSDGAKAAAAVTFDWRKGTLVSLVDLAPAHQPAEILFGTWIGLDPLGNLLSTRNLSRHQIVSMGISDR